MGVPSFTIATVGLISSFFLGYGFGTLLGFGRQGAMIAGAALALTSVAITSSTLKELNLLESDEAKVIVNAAVIDALKEIIRAWGMNPEQILTREAFTQGAAVY